MYPSMPRIGTKSLKKTQAKYFLRESVLDPSLSGDDDEIPAPHDIYISTAH